METGHDEVERPLFEQLGKLGIAVQTHRHPALMTVADSKALRGDLPGLHIKNLFLRDKKRRMWLVTVLEDRQIDLKALRRELGAQGNLSFGSADLLQEVLGVSPGAVTPFSVLHDQDQRVTTVLDRALLAGPVVNAHPLHNRATTAIAPADLLQFMAACGHQPLLMDF